MAAKSTVPNSLEVHLKSGFIKKASAIYATNSNPCGIPNNLTYCGSPARYLMGVAINNKSIYETPSKKATILKILIKENIVVNFLQK